MRSKIIRVACAIIESSDKILVAQRSESMNLSLKWEFPGGKVEKGESPEDCIKREIDEELEVKITIQDRLNSSVCEYEDKTIELIPFVCKLNGGILKVKEHKKIIWEEPYKLKELDWAIADKPIYKEYIKYKEGIV